MLSLQARSDPQPKHACGSLHGAFYVIVTVGNLFIRYDYITTNTV